ncbi:phage tail assembly chaperone [Sphingomonas immobilis]
MLGWRPQEFWGSTPSEFWAAARAYERMHCVRDEQ